MNDYHSINQNIAAHDAVARIYQKIHGEIYNSVEQSRLQKLISRSYLSITTSSKRRVALDFGCGAGNITQYLLDLDCEIIAADVSTEFLTLVQEKFKSNKINALLLNGIDLNGVESESLDFVVAYSVLHHVPDYLKIVSEFFRVLKPGGVLLIDHEVPESYWLNYDEIKRFYSKAIVKDKRYYSKYLRFNNYVDFFIRKFINPRFRREGDIHVFPDDHIQWSKIKDISVNYASIIEECEYLLFRTGYDANVYNEHRKYIGDMKFVVYKKFDN